MCACALIASSANAQTNSCLPYHVGVVAASIPDAARGATQMLAADLNGDGRSDLILAQDGTSSFIWVVLAGSAGGFAPAAPYDVGITNSNHAVAVGDLNADGKPDLVVGSAILLNNGDGTFHAGAPYPYNGQLGPSPGGSVSIGDFNGDGRPDLVYFAVHGGVQVVFGNGDGTFVAGPLTPGSYSNTSIAVGDFNRDGKLDIAAYVRHPYSQDLQAVWTQLGRGDGTFGPPLQTDISNVSRQAGQPFGTADFNGDGRLDLYLGTLVLLGNGDGTFTALPSHFSASRVELLVGVGDFNSDGKVDFVASVSYADLAIAFGNGDGTFTIGPVFYATERSSLVAGDFNGDGKLDVAVGFSTDSVRLLLGDGKGHFATAESLESGGLGPTSIAVGDFNRDGKIDLAVANPGQPPDRYGNFESPGSFEVHLADANGVFGTQRIGIGKHPDYVVAGDFNGDGKLDLAVHSDQSAVLLGNGDGTFTKTLSYSGSAFPAFGAVAADFNGDGNDDVASVSGTTLTIAVATDQQAFSVAASYTLPPGKYVVATADLNGDGKADLVLGRIDTTSSSAAGNVITFLGRGDGTFVNGTDDPVPFAVSHVAISDFNGDGRPDVAASGNAASQAELSILLGKGDGTFISRSDYPIVMNDHPLIVGDFDGDGKPDVICGAWDLSFFAGVGDGTLASPVGIPLGELVTFMTAADFDGDGRIDIAAAQGMVVRTAVLFNVCSSVPPALPPTISSILPGAGRSAGGNTVTLNGSHLANAKVKIGGAAVALSLNTATSITFSTPSHAAKTVGVVVATPAGIAMASYVYLAAPAITAITPSHGWAGEVVTITGSNFQNAYVTFGSVPATISSNTGTVLTVICPSLAPGNVDIIVTTPGGTATMPYGFAVASAEAIPTLSPLVLILIIAAFGAIALRRLSG